MDRGVEEELRAVSRAAFGQSYRLEVMLAVAGSGDGLVTQTGLARELDLAVSNVQGPVRSLIDSGLLTELPRGDGRSRFLLRNPSAAWDWARELHNQVMGRARAIQHRTVGGRDS